MILRKNVTKGLVRTLIAASAFLLVENANATAMVPSEVNSRVGMNYDVYSFEPDEYEADSIGLSILNARKKNDENWHIDPFGLNSKRAPYKFLSLKDENEIISYKVKPGIEILIQKKSFDNTDELNSVGTDFYSIKNFPLKEYDYVYNMKKLGFSFSDDDKFSYEPAKEWEKDFDIKFLKMGNHFGNGSFDAYNSTFKNTYYDTENLSAVPIPKTGNLLAAGLAILAAIGYRRRKTE